MIDMTQPSQPALFEQRVRTEKASASQGISVEHFVLPGYEQAGNDGCFSGGIVLSLLSCPAYVKHVSLPYTNTGNTYRHCR